MKRLTDIAKRIEMATRQHGFFEEDVNEQIMADRKKLEELYTSYRLDMDFVTAFSKARLRVITDILCEDSSDGSSESSALPTSSST